MKHLVWRGLGVGLVAEEAGEFPGFLRPRGPLLAVQGDVDLGLGPGGGPALGRVRRGQADGGLGRLLIGQAVIPPAGESRQG